MNNRIKSITMAAILVAIGIVLPQIFHVFGGTSGAVFLPMHIPVYLAGLLLGPTFGIIVGAILPFASFLLTGMPVAVRLPFMIIELIAYGFFSGFLYKKTKNVWISLIGAQIIGRIVYALGLFISANLLSIATTPAVASVWTAITIGIPGLIIQWILIPPVIYLVKRYVKI